MTFRYLQNDYGWK